MSENHKGFVYRRVIKIIDDNKKPCVKKRELVKPAISTKKRVNKLIKNKSKDFSDEDLKETKIINKKEAVGEINGFVFKIVDNTSKSKTFENISGFRSKSVRNIKNVKSKVDLQQNKKVEGKVAKDNKIFERNFNVIEPKSCPEIKNLDVIEIKHNCRNVNAKNINNNNFMEEIIKDDLINENKKYNEFEDETLSEKDHNKKKIDNNKCLKTESIINNKSDYRISTVANIKIKDENNFETNDKLKNENESKVENNINTDNNFSLSKNKKENSVYLNNEDNKIKVDKNFTEYIQRKEKEEEIMQEKRKSMIGIKENLKLSRLSIFTENSFPNSNSKLILHRTPINQIKSTENKRKLSENVHEYRIVDFNGTKRKIKIDKFSPPPLTPADYCLTFKNKKSKTDQCIENIKTPKKSVKNSIFPENTTTEEKIKMFIYKLLKENVEKFDKEISHKILKEIDNYKHEDYFKIAENEFKDCIKECKNEIEEKKNELCKWKKIKEEVLEENLFEIKYKKENVIKEIEEFEKNEKIKMEHNKKIFRETMITHLDKIKRFAEKSQEFKEIVENKRKNLLRIAFEKIEGGKKIDPMLLIKAMTDQNKKF